MLLSLNLKIKAVSCGLLVLCTLWSAGLAGAQNPIAARWNVPVTFQTLAQTTTSQDYTIVQLRRFFSNSGVVAVRERARVDANGTRSPDYEFDFLGVEGEPQGSPLWQEWAQVYGDHGRLFFEHGLFRVRCLAKVYQNYSLHSFGATTRIGRAAQRIRDPAAAQGRGQAGGGWQGRHRHRHHILARC